MRWLGLAVDPTAGGTILDQLQAESSPVPFARPTLWVPAQTAQFNPGESPLDRNDEVRGRRGNTAPISFQATPGGSFAERAYPKLVRPIISHLLGGAISSTGTAPAAITSHLGPLQEGSLPAFMAWLLREGQLDRLSAAIVSEATLDLPINGEGTISVNLEALFHDSQESAAPKEPSGSSTAEWPPTADYTGEENTYTLRDAFALRGASEEEIPGLAGFKITFNNGMITDPKSKFRPKHNIKVITIDGVPHKIWYPNKHKIGAQTVTGTIDLSDLEAKLEARRIASHAEKLIFEVLAGPLATTPAATEALRIVLSKEVLTGGGADPLVRQGDQTSSFEFTGYVDPGTNTDVEFQFVGKEALV